MRLRQSLIARQRKISIFEGWIGRKSACEQRGGQYSQQSAILHFNEDFYEHRLFFLDWVFFFYINEWKCRGPDLHEL